MITLRESRKAGRTVECWMQQNIDAPDEAVDIASFAWRAMQVAAVPDNADPKTQEDHRKRMVAFAQMTWAWPLND